MTQNTSEQRIIDNLRNQLRLLEEAGIPKYVIGSIQPTFTVNDDLVDQVHIRSAARTTSGTSAVLTTDSTGATWLTGFVLDLSVSTSV